MSADYLFTGGRVVNVYTGEILAQNVAVAGERIVYVGPSAEAAGHDTRVIDVGGDYLLPGFFDAHAHADLYYNPFEYARWVAGRGTTGFFNDGHDLANALGAKSFLPLMAALSKSRPGIYTGAPVAAPPFPGIEGAELWSDADLELALGYDNVLSISEVTPYLRIVNGDGILKKRFSAARQRGRLIEGHTTGADVAKLNRLAAAGVTSCHEALTSRDVLERMRLGYYVMLRQGSIRQDLPQLVAAVKKLQAYDSSRMMLVTDGIFPDHLVCRGNMDWVVAEAVRCGIDAVRAVQMATLNPARYFRLDHLLGAIAPGRMAHLQVSTCLEKPTPRLVMAAGRLVAEEGRLLDAKLCCPETGLGKRPFTTGAVSSDMFSLAPVGRRDSVPVIRIVNQTVTDREDLTIPLQRGRYQPRGDVLLATLMQRDGKKYGQGFVKGFCPGLGGLASSIAHETHGLLVVGQNETDMAAAANAVLKMAGGIVLVQGGRILARLALPIGGICSPRPMPALAEEIRAVHAALGDLGCRLQYPLWTLGFLSFTSVLRLRITYEGVYDVKAGKIVFSGAEGH